MWFELDVSHFIRDVRPNCYRTIHRLIIVLYTPHREKNLLLEFAKLSCRRHRVLSPCVTANYSR